LLRILEEVSADQTVVVNLLADLVTRRDLEEDFLLSWLHAPDTRALPMRAKRMKIVEMKV